MFPIDLYWMDYWYDVPFPVGTTDISQIPLIDRNAHFTMTLPLFLSVILSWKITMSQLPNLLQSILTRVMSVSIVILPAVPFLKWAFVITLT